MEAATRLRAKLEGLLTPMGAWPASDRAQSLSRQGHPDRRHGAPGRHLPVRDDPAQSVLDLDCKAHELDNLYITDASFFPSIGAVNPTLTIIANALRVADRIKERLG